MLAQQYQSVFCLDIYTPGRKYYKTHLSLSEIPDDIPTDAVQVFMYYNRITRIQANVFSELSQCTTVELYHNHITTIEAGAFNGLTVLTR